MNGKNNDIDFVLAWVDGNDPEWRKEKNKYCATKNQDDSDARYIDLDLLRYWFRAIEKYAPWVRKIHFVTCGHYPEWLNREHPKLNLVKHSDFIPSQYLPVFSANPIELNFHRIKGLSERFVYFNDDFYLNAPVTPDDFFVNGRPLDVAAMNAYSFDDDARKVTDLILVNDMYVINRHFNKKTCIKANLSKWYHPGYGKYNVSNALLMLWPKFTGIKPMHIPSSFLKKTYTEVWAAEPDVLNETCMHRFRDSSDVNQWLFLFWQMAKGDFYPRNVKDFHYFPLRTNHEDNQLLYHALIEDQYKMICINDGQTEDSFDEVKRKLHKIYQKKLPRQSKFELP